MNIKMKCIIIAFLVFSSVICVISTIYFSSADVVAVYTRNSLSWSNAVFLEDGSIKLDLTNGKTTVRLKNDVKGNIGFNIYLYAENANQVNLAAKDVTEIPLNEYPDSLEGYDVKCAYRGYLKGNGKKNFKIEATDAADLRLLIIMEDNNSYPKEEEKLPTIANVKFSAEVLLDGQYPRGKAYSFSLKDAGGEVLETVHNDDGYISFSNIALKKKGTYIYYLSQNEGKDNETTYDKSIYTIEVVAEGKNIARVSYEKDGIPKETLPRFSNYKESKENANTNNIAEYPSNAKKSVQQTNYLLISALSIALLLIVFYIVIGRKKG